jgi:hypothetical protein
MKAALLTAGVLSMAVARLGDVHFEVPTSGYTLQAHVGGSVIDKLTKEVRFLLKGNAVATSKQFQFSADSIKGLLSNPTGTKKPYLKKADTTGKTTVIRTVQAGTKLDRTTVTGTKFLFTGDASLGNLILKGPVQITESGTAKSALTIWGSSGSVQFDMRKENAKQALLKASLAGPVSIHVTESGKQHGTLEATGNHLVLDNTVSPARIVLSGSITFHGTEESDTGSASGIDKLTIFLNDHGDLTKISAGEIGP